MLNKIYTGLILFCFVFAINAQDDESDKSENTKRPSWSEGMPERQKQADLNKPSFKPEIDNELELDMSEFGLKDRSQLSIELPINNNLGINGGDPVDEREDSEAKSTAAIEAPTEVETTVNEPLANEQLVEEAVVELPEIDTTVDQQPAIQEQVIEQQVVEQQVDELPAVETPAVEQAVIEKPVVQPQVVEQPVIEQTATNDDMVQEEAVATTNDPGQTNVPPETEVVEIPSQQDEVVVELPIEQEIASINTADAVDTEPTINKIATPADEAIEYKWQIVKREPVTYPVRAAIENLEGWVEVEIIINPSGEVISASPIKYSRKGRVFGKPAVQSVNRWLFSPPSELGIVNNLTRIYKVEFNL